jgi:DNA-directed RNA polymerase subunit RPC12/RpoP
MGLLATRRPLQETREQRCPYCRSDACDRRFLYVRKPTTLLGWMSEGRAVAED